MLVQQRLNHSAARLPETIYLELADYCNLNCTFCGREAEVKRTGDNGGFTDIEKLKQLERPLRAAKYLGLSGRIGEPLLYPRLNEFLRWVFEINPAVRLRITTNGTSLTAKMASLLGGHIDWISVSLNASNASAYARDMRPVGHRTGSDYTAKWNNLVARISEFVAALEPNDRKRVRIQSVTHRDNIDDTIEFVRLVSRIGCSRAVISPMQIHEEGRIETSLYWMKDRYNDVFDEASAIGVRLGVHVEGGRFFTSVKQDVDLETACRDPLDIAYLNMEKQGKTAPCCQWAEAPIAMDVYKDVGAFERFWNSEVYQSLRRKRDFDSCKACGINRVFDEVMFHFTPFLKLQLIKSGRIASAETASVYPEHELASVCNQHRLNLPSLRRTLLRVGLPTERLNEIQSIGTAALPKIDEACWDAFCATDVDAGPVDLDLAGVFAGIGWGNAEYDVNAMRGSRWLGGTNTGSIYIRVAPGQPYHLRLTLGRVSSPALVNRLSLTACGQALRLDSSISDDGKIVLTAYVPAKTTALHEGRLWIVLRFMSSSDDQRISFSRINFAECEPEAASARFRREIDTALNRVRVQKELYAEWISACARIIASDPIGSIPRILRRLRRVLRAAHR